MLRRAVRDGLAPVVVLLLLLVPASAHALTVELDGATVRVTGAGSEANKVTVGRAANGAITVADANANVWLLGSGCTLVATRTASCSAAAVVLALGDGNDTATVGTDVPVTLDGGNGADVLTGGPAADVVLGGAGDDTLRGAGGADDLQGGDGRDRAYGDDGDDLVHGLGGDDHVEGGAGADRLDGGDGADRLFGNDGDDRGDGGPGNDQLSGNDGRDELLGGDGEDTLWGHAGDDVLEGGAGNDRTDGNDGDDVLRGGDGDDLLHGHGGNDQAGGEAGNDRVDGSDGDDVLRGGDGDDLLHGHGGNDQADGEAGNDRVDGSDGNDELQGGADDDRLYGWTGDDGLDGGPGADRLEAGDGADRLGGGDGDDALVGAAGADALDGGTGEDRLEGGDEADELLGGDDADTLWGGAGDDRLVAGTGDDVADGQDGNDVIDGGDDGDVVRGGDGADDVAGGSGDDRVEGGANPDQLRGGDGQDEVEGGGDADRVSGEAGDDLVGGGGGDDVLSGGDGADVLRGDDGQDTADYGDRTQPLVVTNDDKADDGAAGERDDVRSTVDDVIGGSGNDRLTFVSAWSHAMDGGAGDDRLQGGPAGDDLVGGPGRDLLIGGKGTDRLDGGDGDDHLSAADGQAEQVLCGRGRKDVAVLDARDKPNACETRKKGSVTRDRLPQNTVPATSPGRAGTLSGVRRVVGGGRFVAIPGHPGERIDRRLLPDVKYLVAKYRVRVTDGYAATGHSPGGEHPRGLAVDLVPGAGGSWSRVDALARWAEPRRNRPRPPFRWVGYDGDPNHGRGHHLHLSWMHSATRRGTPARVVYRLAFSGGRPVVGTTKLAHLARRTNRAKGGTPSVRTGLAAQPRCRGAAPLKPTWRAAARAFGLRWTVLAGITSIESNFGCLMGPSSAGAIGWTQFMPATWRAYGMDADGDGKASPYNSVDAIYSTARYLRASGAPRSYRKALFAYNHATWYVNDVLRRARRFA